MKVRALITYLGVTRGKVYRVVDEEHFPESVGVLDDTWYTMYLHQDYCGTKEYEIVEEDTK